MSGSFSKNSWRNTNRRISPRKRCSPPRWWNYRILRRNYLAAQLPVLQRFGFHVEFFGTNAFQVRAMPVLFSNSDPAAALRALVEDFEEDEAPLQNELEAKIAGRVCKRLAVKAGQVLSPEEQRALLADLEACASPRTCPHGRPTMIHLSVDMLERQFGRKGRDNFQECS